VRVLIATRSAPKLREIRAILREVPGLSLVDLNDAGIPYSPAEEEIERFETFQQNAAAKARYFQQRTGIPTIADDSGLCVDALEGRPGVHSRRFAPGSADLDPEEVDRANNEHLLRLLGNRDLADRRASYVCVAALVENEDTPVLFEGRADGLILGHSKGDGGFGYDPLFFDPYTGKTFAELPPSEKNARSHRGAAFRALARHLIGRGAQGS
jgi:XTP/dITP diphosphohydrolase